MLLAESAAYQSIVSLVSKATGGDDEFAHDVELCGSVWDVDALSLCTGEYNWTAVAGAGDTCFVLRVHYLYSYVLSYCNSPMDTELYSQECARIPRCASFPTTPASGCACPQYVFPAPKRAYRWKNWIGLAIFRCAVQPCVCAVLCNHFVHSSDDGPQVTCMCW